MKKLLIILLISISLLLTSCFKKEEANVVQNTSSWKIEKLGFDNNMDFIVEDWSWSIIIKNTWSLNKINNSKNIEKESNASKLKSNTWTTTLSWEILSNSWIIQEETDENKIKLINASLSTETIFLSEEDKEFMKNEIDDLDTSSFVKFKNSIYSKDKNNVYFLIFWLNKLIWVNPNTFKVLQPDWYYWTDWTWIYMLEKKIENMDLASLKFAKINEKLIVWWDKNNLYIWSRLIIKWWDINSIVSLSENCIKDNLNVYCSFADFWTTKEWDSYEIVEWVDLNTYTPLDYFYAKDKNFIYFEGYKIEWADTVSFKIFNNSLFAKDENNVYYEWEKLTWINDVNSFVAVNWIPQDETCFYKIDPVLYSARCENEENQEWENLYEENPINEE